MITAISDPFLAPASEPTLRTDRLQAAEAVAEAWSLLEDTGTALDAKKAKKIVRLLVSVIEMIDAHGSVLAGKGHRRPVIGFKGELLIFDDAQAAANVAGCHRNSIARAAQERGTSRGWSWRFIDELTERREEPARQPRDTPVYSVGPDGERRDYPSISEAAWSTGFSHRIIEYAVETGTERTTGMRWHRASEAGMEGTI